jgi:hypothetical protein
MIWTGRETFSSSKRKTVSIKKEVTTITIRIVLLTVRVYELVSVPKYCREKIFLSKINMEKDASETIGEFIASGSLCQTSSSALEEVNAAERESQDTAASPISPPSNRLE